jgi:opacity protein-like surface antigen
MKMPVSRGELMGYLRLTKSALITMLILLFFVTSVSAAKKKRKKQPMFYTEFSIFGSASKYSNSTDTDTLVTSWGGSLGFTFARTETVEIEYKNAYQKSTSSDYEIKTFYDTYGVNYLHSLSTGRFQPFLKIGVGYVRSKTAVYYVEYPQLNKSEKRPPTVSYSGGVGLKMYLTQSISFKASYTAQYIDSEESANGDSNTEFNYFVTGGLSFIF